MLRSDSLTGFRSCIRPFHCSCQKTKKAERQTKNRERIKNTVKQRRGEAKKRKSEETEPRSRKAKKQKSKKVGKKQKQRQKQPDIKITKNTPNGKEKHTAGAYLQHVQYLVYSDLTP